MTSYGSLHPEDSWTEYLRTRLPYSFKRIEEQGSGAAKRFVLFAPEPNLGADYHNYWRRGNIYYVSALMLDRANLSEFWHHQIQLESMGYFQDARSRGLLTPDAMTHVFYNAMQMEKVWRFATEDHLDRERVVMTNCMQALELCLKAIQTHVAYRGSGEFSFTVGHNVAELYRGLPDSLRDEFLDESRSFAQDYSQFRQRITSAVNTDRWWLPGRVNWSEIRKTISERSYTVFLDGTDPGGAPLEDEWLERALREIRDGQYHRYSPEASRDEYPVRPIAAGLILGRFFYEHLFPVPLHNRL